MFAHGFGHGASTDTSIAVLFLVVFIQILISPAHAALSAELFLQKAKCGAFASIHGCRDHHTVSTAPSSIAFPSAVSQASAISNHLAQLSSIFAIPRPSKIPPYRGLTQLASMVPPLQTVSANQDLDQAVAAMLVAGKSSYTASFHDVSRASSPGHRQGDIESHHSS